MHQSEMIAGSAQDLLIWEKVENPSMREDDPMIMMQLHWKNQARGV
jgi:hypothetical protein